MKLIERMKKMTREEDILHALRRLEAMSRRGPKPPPNDRMEHGAPNDMPPPPPESPRQHGRGRMMAVLNDNGAMSQTQLAAHLEIRPQSLSELLTKAENEGLVTRRHSEEDKRQTIVTLTDEGKARVAGFREAHRRRAEEFLKPLTEEEKESLSVILNKLIDAKNE